MHGNVASQLQTMNLSDVPGWTSLMFCTCTYPARGMPTCAEGLKWFMYYGVFPS